jgi:transcription elongation factor GreA
MNDNVLPLSRPPLIPTPIERSNDPPKTTTPHWGVSESSNTALRCGTRATKGTDMATTTRVWISPQAHERLHRELDTLRFLFSAGIADEGSDENATAVRRAWETRIQQIHDLLINAVVGEDPPNDGIAEPGMVVTIRRDATGDTETFLLGVHGAEYADMPVYSIESPLGAAIAGARPGQRRTYRLPNGIPMAVTLLNAVPYGLHIADLNQPAPQ